MNAREHYEAGDLSAAVDAATEEVKRHPADTLRHGFLSELLCFAGDLQRADLHLDAVVHRAPDLADEVGLFRQLVCAEQARQQFFSQGRLPAFLDEPSPHLQCYLEASIRLREGHPSEAAELLVEAERQRPAAPGTLGGKPFDDLRDVDDPTASVFEVLTSGGTYCWVPMDRVQRIEFRRPQRPRDVLWRQTRMVVRGGFDSEVFLPVLYAGSHSEPDDRIRLGRTTAWRGGKGVPIQGVGQRVFRIGAKDYRILELEEITLTGVASDVRRGQDPS